MLSSTHICPTWNRLKCPCWSHTQQPKRPIHIQIIIRKYKFTSLSGNTNSHHHQECQKVLLGMKILRTWWSCWSPRRNSVLCLNKFVAGQFWTYFQRITVEAIVIKSATLSVLKNFDNSLKTSAGRHWSRQQRRQDRVGSCAWTTSSPPAHLFKCEVHINWWDEDENGGFVVIYSSPWAEAILVLVRSH